MKKIMGVLIGVILLAGCGKSPSEAKYQGVTEKKDYTAMGMQYLKSSDIPKAIQNFDLAIKQDPKNTLNYMVLGEVYLKLKEYARAVDTFTGATYVDPINGDAFYYLAVSKMFKANLEKNPKEIQDAREQAVKAAQRSVEIFMQKRDQEKFKRSVALLKSFEAAMATKTPGPITLPDAATTSN